MHTVDKYSMSVRLILHHYPHNIQYDVRLTNAYSGWIFGQCPPDLTPPPIQYVLLCPADQYTQWMNIQSVSAYIDITTHSIFATMSGWPIPTVNEYLISVYLIRSHHPDNMWYDVRLINAYSGWIFDQCPPNPTPLPTQYSIRCSAEQCIQWINIQSVSA